MSRLKTWISALRLRTLPLAISAVLTGTVLAWQRHTADPLVAFFCLLTAVLLQILSNLANDYGDFMKGTDNDQRLGNMRALQSGNIRPEEMLSAIIACAALALASGIWLLYRAGSGNFDSGFALFFMTGIAAIAAAVKYTVGKNAYGYSGLGDAAVFVFFGIVGVGGTFILASHFEATASDATIVLPACGMGLLCAAVLNTNNIRDIDNDRASGKFTIPVKAGLANARRYHAFLVSGGCLGLVSYSFISGFHWILLLQLPALFPILRNLKLVWTMDPSPAYNALLKGLSIGILLFSLVYCFTLAFSASQLSP